MADYIAFAEHWLTLLLGYVGIHGVSLFQAICYALGAATLLAILGAVRSAYRMALLRCPVRK